MRTIHERSHSGMSHIPEDRHKHGLVLDFTLEQNMVLQRFQEPQFQNHGFIRFDQEPAICPAADCASMTCVAGRGL